MVEEKCKLISLLTGKCDPHDGKEAIIADGLETIPIIGTFASLRRGHRRLKHGRRVSAGLRVLDAGASLLVGPGTVVSALLPMNSIEHIAKTADQVLRINRRL